MERLEPTRPEHRLLLECAKLPLAPQASKQATERLLSANLDWRLLLESAAAHRVTPLLGRALEEVGWEAVPAELRTALRARCEADAERGLWLVAELLQVLDALEEHGASALPLHGPALGEVAYGDPRLRCAEGLELLARPDRIEELCGALAAVGFRGLPESELPAEAAAPQQRGERVRRFVRERDGLRVDVHGAAAPPALGVALDHAGLWQRAERFALLGAWVPGLEVPVPALEDLLLLLCVEGSRQGWSQLCWICDVAALVQRHPELDLSLTLVRARAQGAEHRVLVGLALARDLLGLGLPDAVTSRLRADGPALELSARIARQLFGGGARVAPLSEPGGLLERLLAPVRRLLGRRGRRLVRLVLSRRERDDLRSDWRRRYRGAPVLPSGPIRRVLVVCRGNICRSPFASELLASLRPALAVRSAGLAAGEGAPADPLALRAAAAHAVDLRPHSARALGAEDVGWADLILAMEGHHAARIARSWPEARPKTRELGHFLPEPPYTIEDPWGRGEELFASSFERIRVALDRLCAELDAPISAARGAEERSAR